MSTASVAATTTSAASNVQNAVGKGVSTLDYNAFLKLLMAQMKNQDPTNPTDSTQWVSQLATFSNVEQALQMNSKLGQILASSSMAEAESLIGRTLTSVDGALSGKVMSVVVSSSGSVANLDNGAKLAIGAGVTVS